MTVLFVRILRYHNVVVKLKQFTLSDVVRNRWERLRNGITISFTTTTNILEF